MEETGYSQGTDLEQGRFYDESSGHQSVEFQDLLIFVSHIDQQSAYCISRFTTETGSKVLS